MSAPADRPPLIARAEQACRRRVRHPARLFPEHEMDLETKIRDSILDELKRQFDGGRGRLEQDEADASRVIIDGAVDLDAVAMVIAGTLAGGP
jgi:hypothetical protein